MKGGKKEKAEGRIIDENQKAETAKDCHLKSDGDTEEKVIEPFITFPLIDGSLIDVPREDIFLVEKDSNQSTAFGLTCEGSKNYYHEYMLHSKLIIHCLIYILITTSMSLLMCTSS